METKSMNDPVIITKLAEQVLNEPILLRQLSDRVYELMAEDIRNQRDRLGIWQRSFK